MAKVVNLLHHIQFTQRIKAALFGHFPQQRAVLKPDIANMQQPVVDKAKLGIFNRRLHAAAAVVAADDDVFNFQYVDRVLHDGKTVQIGMNHQVGDVTVYKQLARFQAGQTFSGDAAI